MRYFSNPKDEKVYAYDELDITQQPYIQKAIDSKWPEVTDSWPPSPTKEQTIFEYEFFASRHLDSVALFWGYESFLGAISYANSTNTQWRLEAEALLAWRDTYWAEAYTIEQGELPATAEEFVAMLPAAPEKPLV